MDSEPSLPKQIMALIKNHSVRKPDEYVNPYFLQEVLRVLDEYYQLEDHELDDWARDMFGM
jgi:hypothetical protein